MNVLDAGAERPPPSASQALGAIILTRETVEDTDGLQHLFWCAGQTGRYCLKFSGQRAVAFVRSADLARVRRSLRLLHGWSCRQLQLQTMEFEPVTALYCYSLRTLRKIRKNLAESGIACMEADIQPHDRYLMERFIHLGVHVEKGERRVHDRYIELLNPVLRPARVEIALRALALKMAADGHGERLSSICVKAQDAELAFLSDPLPTSDCMRSFPNEKAMLSAFLAWLQAYDPDILMSWRLPELGLLQNRCRRLGLSCRLGRGGELLRWRQIDGKHVHCFIPGRVALDLVHCMRAAFHNFERYSLEFVARQTLGTTTLPSNVDEVKNLVGTGEVLRQMRDCTLIWRISRKLQLLEFVLARSNLTGLPINRPGASIAAFDAFYLPRLHRAGFIAPAFRDEIGPSPGGYVLDSRPGLFRNVLALDFKSLYPSIMRTFHIDPLALAVGARERPDATIPGFSGARFSRARHLLPSLIADLWQERDRARRAGDRALSQAVKIIMNSFYGALGSPLCRFGNACLASSITLRGHEILLASRDRIARHGYEVIYGDTDSLFVLLKGDVSVVEALDIGAFLAADLNRFWSSRLASEPRVVSHLEIELEALYVRFLMPTLRGASEGSKKRYAGLAVQAPDDEPRVIFRGLESARTDWTPLAREFQRELYARIFRNQPYEDYIRELVLAVLRGERDAQLVFMRKLRKDPQHYRRNIPPHARVALARSQDGQDTGELRRGDSVEYLMTKSGPRAPDSGPFTIDYDYYVEKQMRPIADAILRFLHTSFDIIVGGQRSLF